MSLEYWKREKNVRSLEKGYARDPEGFSFKFLLKRLREETNELEEAIINATGYDDMRVVNLYLKRQTEEIIMECADVSNLTDYIASKAAMFLSDKYTPEATKG